MELHTVYHDWTMDITTYTIAYIRHASVHGCLDVQQILDNICNSSDIHTATAVATHVHGYRLHIIASINYLPG